MWGHSAGALSRVSAATARKTNFWRCLIIIDRRAWHARLFGWWYREKHGQELQQTVNLCPYVRVVLFWAPLRLLFLDRILGWICWPLLACGLQWLIWQLFGQKGLRAELVLLIVLLLSGTFIALIYGGACVYEVGSASTMTRSFGRVLAHWYDGLHKHICPTVEIR